MGRGCLASCGRVMMAFLKGGRRAVATRSVRAFWTGDIPMADQSSKERDILMVMRKVLASIIKDTTPPHKSMKHPLSDSTIDDIRRCLSLISSRERELADAAGARMERPYFADEKPAAEVVSLGKLKTRKAPASESGED